MILFQVKINNHLTLNINFIKWHDSSSQNEISLKKRLFLNNISLKKSLVIYFQPIIYGIRLYFNLNLNHIQILKYIKQQKMFPTYPNDNIFFPNSYYISPETYIYQPQTFNPYNFVVPQNSFYNYSMQQNQIPLIQPPIPRKRQQNTMTIQVKPVMTKNICCNCVNTDCRKQYCVCFKNGQICGPKCGCTQCRNNTIQQRNLPAVTNNKITCKCKKSQCSKKYCECFAYGLKCGDHCKCQGCRNCQ